MEKLLKFIKHTWVTGDFSQRLIMVYIAAVWLLPPYSLYGITMNIICTAAFYGSLLFASRLWIYKGIWKKL